MLGHPVVQTDSVSEVSHPKSSRTPSSLSGTISLYIIIALIYYISYSVFLFFSKKTEFFTFEWYSTGIIDKFATA